MHAPDAMRDEFFRITRFEILRRPTFERPWQSQLFQSVSSLHRRNLTSQLRLAVCILCSFLQLEDLVQKTCSFFGRSFISELTSTSLELQRHIDDAWIAECVCVCSFTGGMIMAGEKRSVQARAVSVPLGPPRDQHEQAWDRISEYGSRI